MCTGSHLRTGIKVATYAICFGLARKIFQTFGEHLKFEIWANQNARRIDKHIKEYYKIN